MTGGSWDEAYQGNNAPWDIGRPQPAIVRIADQTIQLIHLLLELRNDRGVGREEWVLLDRVPRLERNGGAPRCGS